MTCKKCKKEIPDNSVFCNLCGSKQISTPRKTIKRENGTGSVYKRSDLKTRPWVAVTPLTKTAQPQIIGYYETAQEAKDALDEFRRNPTTKLNITVKELYEEWKPLGYKDKSKQQCDCYNASWKHLTTIYSVKFRELRTAQMQRVIENMQTGEKVYSYSAISKVKTLLGLLYKYAMENDIVHKDYSNFLVLPKKGENSKERFTDLELKQIEKSAGKVPFADCILMMCYTGFRIGEFLSLTKFSVHYQGNIMALVGGIKTDAGKNRLVPVHSKIRPYFDAWLSKDGETVICKDNGDSYNTKYFREKCYYPALEQIGVRKLSPHATRRTFSTRMSAAGVRQEDMIALMGHTDFSVDIESYINQEAETLAKAIEKLS